MKLNLYAITVKNITGLKRKGIKNMKQNDHILQQFWPCSISFLPVQYLYTIKNLDTYIKF